MGAMEYYTRGKEHHERFRMPIAYSNACAIPRPEDGYCAILAVERGFLAIDDGNGRELYKAPTVLLLRPSHSIRDASVTEGSPHSIIFRPQAINTNAPQSISPFSEDDIEQYFFFRPFKELGPSGFSVKAIPPELVPAIEALCGRIDENLNTAQDAYWPCLSRSYFLELLILLDRNRYVAPDAERVTGPQSRQAISAILEYVHASYAEPITLDGLAARFATNRTTLNRRFNEECGMSAMAYLNAVRIEIAASLLRNTELKVVDIARRTGFADESYFSRAFKKKTGLAPVLYRKSYPNPYG